jgi:hypothetical protein
LKKARNIPETATSPLDWQSEMMRQALAENTPRHPDLSRSYTLKKSSKIDGEAPAPKYRCREALKPGDDMALVAVCTGRI